MAPAPIPENNRREPPGDKDNDNLDLVAVDLPPAILAHSSSDSDNADDEVIENQGYQMLPQEPITQDSETDEESDTAADDQDSAVVAEGDDTQHQSTVAVSDDSACASTKEPSYMQMPPVVRGEVAERTELWKSGRNQTQALNLSKENMEKIKVAMAGFSLPSACVPDWAKVVPEDDWKCKLLSRLNDDSVPSSPRYLNSTECCEPRTNQDSIHCTTTDPSWNAFQSESQDSNDQQESKPSGVGREDT